MSLFIASSKTIIIPKDIPDDKNHCLIVSPYSPISREKGPNSHIAYFRGGESEVGLFSSNSKPGGGSWGERGEVLS